MQKENRRNAKAERRPGAEVGQTRGRTQWLPDLIRELRDLVREVPDRIRELPELSWSVSAHLRLSSAGHNGNVEMPLFKAKSKPQLDAAGSKPQLDAAGSKPQLDAALSGGDYGPCMHQPPLWPKRCTKHYTSLSL